jgi:hypothetical protein
LTVDAYGRITTAANVSVQGMDYLYVNNSTSAANNYAGAMANSVNNYTTATYVKLTSATPQVLTSDISIGGNLTITGVTTYANTTQLLVGDNLVVMNAELPVSSAPLAVNTGIRVNRGTSPNTSIFWNEATQFWTFTNDGSNYDNIATYANTKAAFDAANGVAVGANAYTAVAFGVANGAFDAANGVAAGANAYTVLAFGVANGAYTVANAAFGAANAAGVTLVNETASASAYYPIFTTTTSGIANTANVSTTKLTFVPSTGTLSATIFNSLSDRQLKENITSIEDAADIVSNLTGVRFTWKDSKQASYGFIAQDVEQTIPELVSDINNNKTVNYDGIIAFLVEAVKELSERVKELENQERQ